MAESSNGSTLTFGATAQADVRSITFTEDSSPIDITTLGASEHLYESGLIDLELTAEAVGINAIDVGDTGSVAIAWNDGGSDSVTGMICISKEATGSIDTEITTSLTFKQSS